MKRKLAIGFVVAVVLVLSQYDSLLTGYARLFTVNNPTVGADAIVILSGGGTTRVPKALELYQGAYAARLLLTSIRPMNPQFAHIYPTNHEAAREIARALDSSAEFEVVPSDKGGATSTFDEARDLLTFCTRENIRHLIIVTDAFHTRRALYAFEKVFEDSNIKLEAAAAPNEIFNDETWWKSDVGISAYLLEPIKLAVYLMSNQNAAFIRND